MVKIALTVLLLLLSSLMHAPQMPRTPATDILPDSITAYASAEDHDNYICLGSVTTSDGFTRESIITEAPLAVHRYTPVDESDPLTRFTVSGAVLTPEEMCSYLNAYYSAIADSVSDGIQAEVNGRAACICSMTASAYVEEGVTEEEAERIIYSVRTQPPNRYFQYISMYISADNSHSIGVSACLQGTDDSFYLADNELEAYMRKLAQVIVFPEA